MRTPATRRQHSRKTSRYESDLTDAEWRLIGGMFPAPAATGRPRAWPLREIVSAIFYVLRGGIAWRLLPTDFPPWPTVYRWFCRLGDDGTWERINHALVMADRERAGRQPSPTAAIIDSQSVKTTEAGGPRGFDAGKRIRGRKRHALAATDGRLLDALVQPAHTQDRDGAVPVIALARPLYPWIMKVFADMGYRGAKLAAALDRFFSGLAVEIVRRPADQVGFAVHPRRWVIERLFAWLGRNRRLAKDFEASLASARAFLYAASVMLLARRIARSA